MVEEMVVVELVVTSHHELDLTTRQAGGPRDQIIMQSHPVEASVLKPF